MHGAHSSSMRLKLLQELGDARIVIEGRRLMGRSEFRAVGDDMEKREPVNVLAQSLITPLRYLPFDKGIQHAPVPERMVVWGPSGLANMMLAYSSW